MELSWITILVFVALIVAFKSLIKYQKDERTKAANKDLNIEFGATEGTGINLVKKEYPDMEVRDDPRTGIEKKPHSISKGMNDSCREHKHDYPKGK